MMNIVKNTILTFVFVVVAMITTQAQQKISGKVSSGGKPVNGATVQVRGTNTKATTNANGDFEITVPNNNAVLVVSSEGFKKSSFVVGNNPNFDFSIEPDESDLGEVIITASRQPVRKLETVTAVEVIGSKQLKAIKPEGLAEAVTQAPGLYVNTSQGRRGAIITRGFPDGGNPLGGLDYTSILVDGLPSFGSTGRIPEAGFGFDNNVEKVEVVRGSAATLFGRASAAGAINIISRKGGNEHGGSVRLTSYNNVFKERGNGLNWRVDWNANGPITKDNKVKYNVGGWFLNDKGFKNTGFNDEGYQLRGNFDFESDDRKLNARLYFIRGDFTFQNLTDVPANLNTMQVAGNWKQYQTMQNFPAFYDLRYTVYGRRAVNSHINTVVPSSPNGIGGDSINRSIREQMDRNSYSNVHQVGFNFSHDFGNGWLFENKFRYQSVATGTKYSFALPSFYRNNYVARLLLDGDANDEDIIDELRISKQIVSGKTKHFIQLGGYHSKTNLKPTTYSFIHTLNPTNADTIKFTAFAPPFLPFAWSNNSASFPRGGITRRGVYYEDVNAVFLGDEIKFNNKLTINVGGRYDWMYINMRETKLPFDSTLTRRVKHKDWSASFGFNYLVNSKTSIYGNVNKAFKAPDYTAYTSLEWTAAAANAASQPNRNFLRVPGSINKNENIMNSELGFRTTAGAFSFDIAGFYTKINDRLSRIFENGIVVSKPFGSNRISGVEASVNLAPNSGSLKGFSFRSSLTLQNAIFTNFKITIDTATASNNAFSSIIANPTGTLNVDPTGNLYGNVLINEGGPKAFSINVANKKLPGVPPLIWNAQAAYTHKYFGLDFSSNYNAARYADATNVIKYNPIVILNAGFYGRLPLKGKKEIRLGYQIKNLTNNQSIQNIAGLAATDVALGMKQRSPNFTTTLNGATEIWGQGYVQLPRRSLLYLSYEF